MKFALVHISGQHKGKTQFFDSSSLSLGGDCNNDLVFPADGRHDVDRAVRENSVVYDAQTTGGASGSPVFNSQGEVIAVNAAIMTSFGGASFGVPINRVDDLLPPAA